MARLAIRGLRKSYGKVEALKGVDLDIAEGEFCVFVGPSGCGKSTMLRTIAGLEDIDSGTVAIDGEVINALRPRDRNIAMVFQNYALYPYLSVYENIAFGLRARKTPDAEVKKLVGRAAEMLGIEALLERTPRQLSGGQRQRVAIGRAVVRDARLFLFDEPLSNLDAQLRDGMRAEIKRLHQEIGKTTIYVTHDQIEAMTLADRIVLLRDGKIEQQGPPLELFEQPATRFVAGFLGSPQMNFIACTLGEANGKPAAVFADGRSLAIDPRRAASLEAWRGRAMVLGVRPEHMRRAEPDQPAKPGEASIPVLIDLMQPTGTRTYAQFRIGDLEATVELPSHSVERAGAKIDLLVDMARSVLIDPDTDKVVSNGAAEPAAIVTPTQAPAAAAAAPAPAPAAPQQGGSSMSASRSVKLFGTDEPAGETTPLKAGALEAVLDAGNLRYIRIGGVEALRGVAFLSRDKNWGTYNPEITNLQIQQSDERFTVSYDAVCKDSEQSFRYSAKIEGRADGGLTFEAEGEALSDFVTNRTGFVVLHALAGVVDHPVTVEHTDGRIVEDKFPQLVNPACPFQDIRALTHEIAPGVKLSCRMEGDAFEMEDHRNWMDASYKTYVRPLALPWPYTIGKGEKTPQKVTLSLSGQPPAPAIGGAGGAVATIGGEIGATLPRLGLAVPAEHAAAALERTDLLKQAGPGFLVCHFDARQGHGAAEMRRFGDLGAALGVELALEAVLPCVDASGAPSADPEILKRDIAAIRAAAEGVNFARVAVSPASDLKCTLPGSTFPPAPGWAELFAEARAAFPGAIVGGGMFSYFTELNRKRPPAELLDFICHTGCPIVHAGDDVSATETLEALPSIFRTVRSFAGGKPYWVFPTAVSMRANPYGAAPAENPDNIRQAMNRVDPRDRALLGAAWYAGYIAHAARAGLDAVTLSAVAGPSGVIYARQAHAQPWFDSSGAKVMPGFHVFAAHARLQGATVLETGVDRGRDVQALAVAGAEGRRLILTNLTGDEQIVRVDGASGTATAEVLDETSFEALCLDPASAAARSVDLGAVTLAPYAVADIALD